MFMTGCAVPAVVLLSAAPAPLPAMRSAASPASPPTVADGTDTTLPVSAVESVGMTVSDMSRAVDFYTGVLSFTPVSDVEVAGRPHELLSGVFGARMRVVTLRLGHETLQLTEYLTPRGRAIPEDLRPNDHAFQHVAIIVSDMAAAYARLRSAGVAHASPGPQRLPALSRRSTSAIRIATASRSCSSRPARAARCGNAQTACSSASTTPPSWCPTPNGR
jgi:catechol 2,3-dioxygenase-like lactoylglutathione lyase family enzyme